MLQLLLRSTGNEHVERARVTALMAITERLATVAGRRLDGPDASRLLLRVQLVLGACIGIAALGATAGLQPLSSADAAEVSALLRTVITDLLEGA